jgi:drug/metabolite transporter, DME family
MKTSSQNQSTGGIIAICFAGVFWGISGTSLVFAPIEAQASIFGVLRLGVTGLFLMCVLAFQGKPKYRAGWNIPSVLAASGSMASMQFFFFNAVDLAGVAMGTTVFIGSYPIFAGILGFLIRKERPSFKWGLSTLLTIIGVVLMTLGSAAIANDPIGIIYALGAGASYAVYSVSVKGLLSYRSGVSVMAVTSSIGALLLSPLFLIHDISWIVRDFQVVLPLAIYLGLVTSVCPLLLFAKGLRQVHVATAATLNVIEPLTATLLGVVVLGELLALQSWIGMGLLIGGVLWLSLPTGKLRKWMIPSY